MKLWGLLKGLLRSVTFFPGYSSFLLLLALPLCLWLVLLRDGGELFLPSLLLGRWRKEVAEEVHGVEQSLCMEMDIQG